MITLEGRYIFLTGASAGIGAATAKTLAEAGAYIIASDINAEGAAATVEAIRAAGGQAEAQVLDVCDPAAIPLDEMERTDCETGLVTLCVGGGMGIATIIERV